MWLYMQERAKAWREDYEKLKKEVSVDYKYMRLSTLGISSLCVIASSLFAAAGFVFSPAGVFDYADECGRWSKSNHRS